MGSALHFLFHLIIPMSLDCNYVQFIVEERTVQRGQATAQSTQLVSGRSWFGPRALDCKADALNTVDICCFSSNYSQQQG